MMEYETLIVKENESLVLSCMITDNISKSADISNLEITATVKNLSGNIFTEMEVSIDESNFGQFTCKLGNVKLPPNTYLIDIKYNHNESGLSIPTSTFKLIVKKGVSL